VTFEIKNAGTGKIPLELAAVRGERVDDNGKPRPATGDARTRIVLGLVKHARWRSSAASNRSGWWWTRMFRCCSCGGGGRGITKFGPPIL
jgi:hypothetical protein